MRKACWNVSWIMLVALAGCAPGGAIGPASNEFQSPPPQKVITIGVLDSLSTFGGWSSLSSGVLSFTEVYANGLVTSSVTGENEARLAARLPSLADGSVVILPDGRMKTTWQLRPNIKWHDGAPFTAEDIVFTWKVVTHPDVPLAQRGPIRQFDNVEALDPTTAVITWKTTYFQPLELGVKDLLPLPKHLLAEGFAGDKAAFSNLPFWTTEWINVGPFRMVDFGFGENLVFERFDDYFLGRPKVDRIILKTIPNPNTLVANLRAGTIDLVGEDTVSIDVVTSLREEWARSGAGTVVQRQGSWAHLQVQFKPEFARPPELSRDVRVRRGLYQGIDLDALREVQVLGLPETRADSFLREHDPFTPVVGKPFVRYRYDRTRASEELAAGGWRRGPSGQLVNQAGEPIQVDLRASPGGKVKDNEIIASYWRPLGIEVIEEVIPAALAMNQEYRATFPGLINSNKGPDIGIFQNSFHTRTHATPQNNFRGTNYNGYSNPVADQLIDKLFGSIDPREQGLIGKELGEILAVDLPLLPLYFGVDFGLVMKGVRALDDFASSRGAGLTSRHAHLWDRD